MRFRVIWSLCPLWPCQSPSDVGVLVSVSCTPTAHRFAPLPIQFVEECLKVRPHVGERKLSAMCPEEALQCFHAMLLGQPSWPAPVDCGFSSKPGPTQIPLLYLGSHVLPSTSGTEKYVSASPSPPGISEDCSVSPVSPVVYFRESRSLHSGQQPESSSFGVFSVRIPAAHRVFADIHRGSKITFQRCPASQKRGEGRRICVFCQTVPKLRSTVCPEKLG